jgi:spermidine/putrescine transport system substrate-binding protein
MQGDRVSMDRRAFLRTSGYAGLAAFLAACSSSGPPAATSASSSPVSAPPSSAPVDGPVAFATWPGAMPAKLAATYGKQFGTDLLIKENINSMEEFTATITPQLIAGEPTGYDLMDLDDTAAPRFVANGWLDAIDPSAVPHAQANVLDRLRSVPWDTNLTFHYPYAETPFSIGYNTKTIGHQPTSFDEFLNPQYQGRVGVYSGVHATVSNFSLLLRQRGEIDHTPNELTVAEAITVLNFLKPYFDKDQFRVTGLQYNQLLASGDLWMAFVTPTDVLYQKNPDISFSYADEGSVAYLDHFTIPAQAEHARAAEAAIDFFYVPENQARLVQWSYQFPVAKGVEDVLAKTDPKLLANPWVFPSDDIVSNLYSPPPWTPEQVREVSKVWDPLVGH